MSCCSVRWHYVCCYSSLPGIFGTLETVYRWRSRLCLLSPTWWFRLVRVPEGCQVQSPWWCQIVPHQCSLSSAKSHWTTVMFSLMNQNYRRHGSKHLELCFVVCYDVNLWLHDDLILNLRLCLCKVNFILNFYTLPFLSICLCVSGNTWYLHSLYSCSRKNPR